MFDLNDKVVLVTGAAGGIGAGIARAVLDKGAKHVAILDVNIEMGTSLQEELNSKHGANRAKFIKCDVTQELDTAFENTVKEFGYIDVVINNAGIMNDAPHIYEKEIAVNVTALITSSLKAYNMMDVKQGGKGGTIINISSIVGLFQGYGLPVYSATKSAVLQFSNCLGMTENYSRSGVRVVTICFGCTDTNLIQGKIGAFDKTLEDHIVGGINNLPHQNVDSAVRGLIEAYEKGDSGSTWLVTSGRPAEDITVNVKKAYQILVQGVLY
ncbi:15-hydroxyprostaglandin dehydrogenase [NAD(+)]-like [Epargyreus clarus]|uniref:15-hydroxyprostaglandin dehydrogenase [NAD(+)]-like n=1 Tax=Epargyreus clarus TaxID=520877 RepID=UPI003C2BD9C7